jgi:GNAT superfamily N-acetyltransferase
MTTVHPAPRRANEPGSIVVRAATPEDAAAIRDVAAAAWRSTYAGQIADESIERFIASAYTPERVATRIERHVVLVAGATAGLVEAFAETVAQEGHVQVVAIYARPDARGRGLGSALLERVVELHPGEALAADVLVGNALAEPFYAARGFQPGELLTDEIAGEEIVERRWWRRAGRSPA